MVSTHWEGGEGGRVWFSMRVRRHVHLEALQPAHIHHVVAAFWHEAHHFHRFLFGGVVGDREEVVESSSVNSAHAHRKGK